MSVPGPMMPQMVRGSLPRLLQPSLVSGELSPYLWSRVDLARYASSLALCRNFLIRHWGGADNRTGTQYVGSTLKGATETARLIKFVFSNTQTYVLEFGSQYIRFITNGAYIQQTLANCPAYDNGKTYYPGAWVQSGGLMYYCTNTTLGHVPTNATYWRQQTQYQVFTPYSYADLPEVKYVQSADVIIFAHNEYAPQQLSRLADNIWTFAAFQYINGPFQQPNTDESTHVWASANNGNVTITSNKAIFVAGHVGGLLRMDESELQAIFPWEPDKNIASNTMSPNGQLRRSDGKVYQCVTTGSPGNGNPEWRTGTIAPVWEEGTQDDGDGRPITSGGTIFAGKAGVAWRYLHSQYGIVLITGFTDSKHVTGQVLSYLPDSVVGGGQTLQNEYNGAPPVASLLNVTATPDVDRVHYVVTVTYEDGSTLILRANNSYYDVYIASTQIHFNPSNPVLFPTGTDIWDANITNIRVDYILTGAQNLTDNFSFGSFSPNAGFPAAVGFFGDRLIFGGTPQEPANIWLSTVSQYVDFGESTPIVDSDAITLALTSRKVNLVKDFAVLNRLVVMTTGSEIAIYGDQGDLLAPTTANVKPQSHKGISDLHVQLAGNSAIFVQSRGPFVRDLEYLFQIDAYTGNDLTAYASHLVLGYTLVDLDFSEIPYSVLWFVRNDGTLLSCTYVKEENVLAWARHDTTNGAFENVCVVPEGNEDITYVIVRRVINGQTVRYVERLSSRQFATIDDGIFMDAALSYDGTNYTATSNMTLTGGVTWNNGEALTLTASGAGNTPFLANQVGCMVNLTGSSGDQVRVKIIAYTSSTIVTVRAMSDVPADLQGTATATWGLAQLKFSGINHLIGQTVSILADGSVQGQVIVDGTGAVTLNTPGVKVHVGLPITAQIQTLELNHPFADYSAANIRAQYKNIPKVNITLNASRGIWAGTDFNDLFEYKQRWAEIMGEEVQPVTGTIEMRTTSSNEISARCCIQVTDPLPVSVLGILPEVSLGQ